MPQGATLSRPDETSDTHETDYFFSGGRKEQAAKEVGASAPTERACPSLLLLPSPLAGEGPGGEGVGGQLDVLMPKEGGRGSSTVCDVAAGLPRHLRRHKAASTLLLIERLNVRGSTRPLPEDSSVACLFGASCADPRIGVLNRDLASR